MLSSISSRFFALCLAAGGLFVGTPALADEPSSSEDPFAKAPESAGRGEVGLSASAGYGRSTPDVGGRSYDGVTSADGAAFGRYYFRPLREMPGPRSYLPFLQRASSIGVSGSIGGSWMDPALTGRAITGVYGGVGVNGVFYVLPELVVGGSAFYSQSSNSDRLTARRFISPSAFVGLRTGDNLLNLEYAHTFAVIGGELQPARLGSLSLADSILVDRQLAMSAFVSMRDRGLQAGGGVTLYPIDELGIYGGGSGGRAAFDVTSDDVYNLYRGYAGIAGWLTRFVQLGATYDMSVGVSSAVQARRTNHSGTLSILVRIP